MTDVSRSADILLPVTSNTLTGIMDLNHSGRADIFNSPPLYNVFFQVTVT